jgi:hypothetical protein
MNYFISFEEYLEDYKLMCEFIYILKVSVPRFQSWSGILTTFEIFLFIKYNIILEWFFFVLNSNLKFVD